MGRLRCIEPEFWENGQLDRLGMIAKIVFAYLFSKAADDEGRFEWDPYTVWRSAFSPVDSVSEESVSSIMAALAAPKCGMVLRYGSRGRYGFLTGWFAHQAMDRRFRRPSKLPPPPVPVPSWEDAERVRSECSKAKGFSEASKVSFRDALAWFDGQHAGHTSRSRVNHARVTREPRESHAIEVEGVEVGVEEGVPPPPLSTAEEQHPRAHAREGDHTERTSADYWLAQLFNVPEDGLPEPWSQLLPGWEDQYGRAEVATVAEITHGKFCTEATIHLGKVRSYMRKTLENRKRDRETIERDPSPSTARGKPSRRQGVPPAYDPSAYEGDFTKWPEEQ